MVLLEKGNEIYTIKGNSIIIDSFVYKRVNKAKYEVMVTVNGEKNIDFFCG